MRLTLRTLLAYLDDVLEPSQAKEIGEKISESTVASSLVSRIREVLRRRRLTAPDLNGPDSRINPNIIAEYLDNTLPPEVVADVERICLESDMHLAEAAACHQILTLVLGEPVDIPSNSRERMYALGTPAARQQLSSQSERTANEPILPVVPPIVTVVPIEMESGSTFSSTIPDHVRQPVNWRRMLPVAAVVAVGAIWVILLALDPAIPGFFGRQATEPTAAVKVPSRQPDLAPGPPVGAPETDSDELDVVAVEPGMATEPADVPGGGPSDDVTPPALASADTRLAASPDESGAVSPFEIGPAFSTESATRDSAPAVPEMADAGQPSPVSPFESESTPPSAQPVQPDDALLASTITVAPDDGPAVEQVAAAVPELIPPPQPPKIEYNSVDGILLRYDQPRGEWFLMPRRSVVYPGERIASPQPFNSILDIDGGALRVTLLGGDLGGTSVRIMEPTATDRIGLDMQQGRLLLEARSPLSGGNAGEAPDGNAEKFIPLAIRVGDELWRLELLAGTTIAGLELEPREPSGLEQSLGKNWYIGKLFVASGTVKYDDGTGKPETINGPAWLDLDPVFRTSGVAQTDNFLNPPILVLPKWVEGEVRLSSATARYASLFEGEFDPTQPVLLNLPALVKDPRPRIAEYAVECLGVLQAYGPLTEALSETPHHEARQAAIRELRRWLPRSAENAELLKAELLNYFHPDDAEDAYRLLWGYTQDDARDRLTSNKLVDWLDHENIVIRELAYYQIFWLTGRHYTYRPHNPAPQRAAAIRRWRDHVQEHGGLYED